MDRSRFDLRAGDSALHQDADTFGETTHFWMVLGRVAQVSDLFKLTQPDKNSQKHGLFIFTFYFNDHFIYFFYLFIDCVFCCQSVSTITETQNIFTPCNTRVIYYTFWPFEPFFVHFHACDS